MKKLFAILLVLVLVLSMFAGCGDAPTQGEEDEAITIGVTNSTLKESVYVYMRDAAEAYLNEEGAELVWQSSENDPTAQLNQIENFIAQGVKCVTLESVRSETAAELVNLLHDAGIPVINLEAAISGVACDLRIGADNYEIGVMQVEKLVEEWGTEKPANVVILSGTLGDESAESLTQGELETLAKYPNFNVIVQQYHNGWDRQLSMNTMENALAQHENDIQIVIGNNDTLMHGGLKAAENAGVAEDMLFFGGDFDLDTAEMLLGGKDNVFVVDRNSILQGQRIAEASLILARGEEPEYDVVMESGTPFWITPLRMVDSTNVSEFAAEKYPELI